MRIEQYGNGRQSICFEAIEFLPYPQPANERLALRLPIPRRKGRAIPVKPFV
jgi:hypothetical protein